MNKILADETIQNKIKEYSEKINQYWKKNPDNAKISDVRARLPDGSFQKDPNENELKFIDLVMEGGGVLGFALVGYTYLLEEMGIRFVGLGGTSAGSINALLLASLDKFTAKKSEKVLDIIDKKSFFDFVDGGWLVKKLINFIIKLNKTGNKKIKIGIINSSIICFISFFVFMFLKWPNPWLTLGIFTLILLIFTYFYLKVRRLLGINPGNNFEYWLEDVLKVKGLNPINSINDIERNFYDSKIEIYNIEKNIPISYCVNKKLAIISSEVITESKIQLPFMSKLFFNNPDCVHPSKFVRMSMSIPFFFKPVRLTNLPNSDYVKRCWWDWAGYGRSNDQHRDDVENSMVKYPTELMFEDGGIISNFPIDCFHTTNKFISSYNCDGSRRKPIETYTPSMPTFGVKLGIDRCTPKIVYSPLNLGGQIFNTSRHLHDYEFLISHPDYRMLVSYIRTDETKVNWLDFNMNDEDKKKLFLAGMQTAYEFLMKFNWIEYKKTRAELEKVIWR